MKNIHITNDIGKLKKVLLHRPNKELLNLTPDTLEDLLFDDIPYLDYAQKEHDKFAETLRNNEVEVVYLEDLVEEVLSINEDIKEKFIKQFISEADSDERYSLILENYLKSISPKELVEKTMSGIRLIEIDKNSDNNVFITHPMPNLYFTRDNFACIENGVSINHMYSKTRNRETIYAEYIFNYHPDYKDTIKYYDRTNKYHIEGGDISVLNSQTVIVGLSQRTEELAVIELAKSIFNNTNSTIENIIIFSIPKKRACMHLDTAFTQVDYNTFVYYPEIIDNFKAYQITKEDQKLKELNKTLSEILELCINQKIKLIKCAGGDPIDAAREQWSDGANTLCIEPGVVITYDRNPITNEYLRKAGIKVIEIPSSELSRGRGGPRCMSMPLIREEI